MQKNDFFNAKKKRSERAEGRFQNFEQTARARKTPAEKVTRECRKIYASLTTKNNRRAETNFPYEKFYRREIRGNSQKRKNGAGRRFFTQRIFRE